MRYIFTVLACCLCCGALPAFAAQSTANSNPSTSATQQLSPATPAKPVPIKPAQPQPGGTASHFYGNDYMQCLQVARHRSQFVHESMREQAIGELLNECMFARGHVQYAPIDGRSDNSDVENLLLFHSY